VMEDSSRAASCARQIMRETWALCHMRWTWWSSLCSGLVESVKTEEPHHLRMSSSCCLSVEWFGRIRMRSYSMGCPLWTMQMAWMANSSDSWCTSQCNHRCIPVDPYAMNVKLDLGVVYTPGI
jgi:hypothetical protein